MMVGVDNTFLTLLFHPKARPPKDPSTGLPVDRLDERIDLLIETLEEDAETIIIPTPVLTEFLVLAENDGPRYLTEIDQNRLYRIEPFDVKAAIELAAFHLHVRASGGGRRGVQEGTYAKISFDRQIVAIAKVNGAHTIYSDDEGVKKFAERHGITVVATWELPLPDEKHPLFRYEQEDASESNNALGESDETETDG
jgi:predicted nucleic acid-binding protein